MQPIQAISAQPVIFIQNILDRIKKRRWQYYEPVSSVSFLCNMHFIFVNGAEHKIESSQPAAVRMTNVDCITNKIYVSFN